MTFDEFLREFEWSQVSQGTLDDMLDLSLATHYSPPGRAAIREKLEGSPEWTAFVSNFQQDDQAYLCTTAEWMWKSLCGREWIVIVRNGQIVDMFLTRQS